MRVTILVVLLTIVSFSAAGQNRKAIGNFSQLKLYYNPSLTAFDGSQINTLYRNQWTGFEDAPRTIALAAEFKLADLKRKNAYQLNSNGSSQTAGQHGIGLLLLRDLFGPFSETQVNFNYSSAISLSQNLELRWGAGLNYTSLALDGNKLTLDNQSDPRFTDLLNRNSRSGKLDLGVGLALSSRSFYVSYAMQDITEGKVFKTGDDFINELYARKHIGMAGLRTNVSDNLAFVLNGLYQYDAVSESTVEAQLKGVYHDSFWLGAGYRNKLAFTATAGLRVNNLLVSYLYENPVAEATTIDKPTNEIVVAYRLNLQKEEGQVKR
ncbi:PorP/SprF family type IX secretion system membrane protein [Pontibacter burrus]|uniref:Type IX secretion system membrane protein PorP/SprF n=1 Tax=Pontibacter burrus TaxID=2704466 RepID=A0A6B3M062_9BACT|nr:PorP/SprF family type IX secretion system membrane protein [Pontibacter burrus]NEM99184.1 type IX secretion system membrane protein PorP/SprF [Pontibacter burrus]